MGGFGGKEGRWEANSSAHIFPPVWLNDLIPGAVMFHHYGAIRKMSFLKKVHWHDNMAQPGEKNKAAAGDREPHVINTEPVHAKNPL